MLPKVALRAGVALGAVCTNDTADGPSRLDTPHEAITYFVCYNEKATLSNGKVKADGCYLDVFGIIISMYYFDTRQHNLPHIHVRYQEQEAVFSILDGEVLEGQLKINKQKLVQAWIEIHHDELMADWQLASQGQSVFAIDPLK